jgi:sugar phosphate isomerase/epimerase
LETGQETAAVLVQLLGRIDRPNVGVNLDPGNMLLYGVGNPVEAVRLLRQWIRQVHIKDARQARTPGEWGDEVPVGTGEVDWAAFFEALDEGQVACDLVIEREAGGQRVTDIQAAREFVEKIVLNPLLANRMS